MTFSIAARCAETGKVGVAVTSSSICVASRCAFTGSTGAALSQNITDPRIGTRLLQLCGEGQSAEQAMAQVVEETPNVQWRQLGVIDKNGGTAFFSGDQTLGVNAMAKGKDCIAMGNLLDNTGVPAAIVDAFEKSEGPLAERILSALEAGLEAGGEAGPIHSAGMQVSAEYGWPIVDLRVDWEDEPDQAIPELRKVWENYKPEEQPYLTRALDPANSESYGVPGDE